MTKKRGKVQVFSRRLSKIYILKVYTECISVARGLQLSMYQKMIKYNTIVIRTVFYAVYSPVHVPVIKFLYIIIPYSYPYAG